MTVIAFCAWGGVQAATATTGTSGSNCVAEPTPTGQPDPGPITPRCFASFAQAISAATSGRVNLPASATPQALTSSQVNAIFDVPDPVTPATTYVLSIDFQDSQGQGASFTWYQSAPCGNYQASSMPSGWNDAVSSTHTYSGCASTLFANASFGQPSWQVGVDSGASFGGTTFNDQTSSEKWCTHVGCS
jgi:hypothetical protein